jgi:hypothetical protein
MPELFFSPAKPSFTQPGRILCLFFPELLDNLYLLVAEFPSLSYLLGQAHDETPLPVGEFGVARLFTQARDQVFFARFMLFGFLRLSPNPPDQTQRHDVPLLDESFVTFNPQAF